MTFSVALPNRIRLTDATNIYVAPAGQDIPTQGLTYGTNGSGAFQTPGYAVAWCGANLDLAGQPLTILIDGNAQYSTTPVPGSRGGVFLIDLIGANSSWTQCLPTITGAINGVAITPGSTPDATWPVLAFNGISAVCGVANNTVWTVQCLQLESTIADVEADRCSKINVQYLVHGSFTNPYPSPYKYSSIYGSSIEILNQIYVKSSGLNLWYVVYNSVLIGILNAPIIDSGVTFSNGTTNKDPTSSLVIPTNWPQ